MTEIITWFTEPFSFYFMQKAFVMTLMVSSCCAIFSCFLVLKGLSLMGDAISHAVLPGVALAYIFHIPLFLGALGAGIFCASSIGFIKNRTHLKEDVVVGIVFSGMFAVGLVLLTKIETDIHLLHILFGHVLGISQSDLYTGIAISSLCLLLLLLKSRDLKLYCFDPNYLKVAGIHHYRIHYFLLTLLSLCVVTALKVSGVVLVIAMLIAPGATAYLLSYSLRAMMFYSFALAIIATLLGCMLSFHLDVDMAPLIVLIQMVFFILSLIKNKLMMGKKERLA